VLQKPARRHGPTRSRAPSPSSSVACCHEGPASATLLGSACEAGRWPCLRPPVTRAVIWAAAPAPAPAPQDPRCRVPAASRLPRLPIRRPGSASYNAVLWPRAYRACHASCSAAPRAPRPAGRPRASRSRILHATPSTPLLFSLISRGRRRIRPRTIAALRRADGHQPGRLDLVAVRSFPRSVGAGLPRHPTEKGRTCHFAFKSFLPAVPEVHPLALTRPLSIRGQKGGAL